MKKFYILILFFSYQSIALITNSFDCTQEQMNKCPALLLGVPCKGAPICKSYVDMEPSEMGKLNSQDIEIIKSRNPFECTCSSPSELSSNFPDNIIFPYIPHQKLKENMSNYMTNVKNGNLPRIEFRNTLYFLMEGIQATIKEFNGGKTQWQNSQLDKIDNTFIVKAGASNARANLDEPNNFKSSADSSGFDYTGLELADLSNDFINAIMKKEFVKKIITQKYDEKTITNLSQSEINNTKLALGRGLITAFTIVEAAPRYNKHDIKTIEEMLKYEEYYPEISYGKKFVSIDIQSSFKKKSRLKPEDIPGVTRGRNVNIIVLDESIPNPYGGTITKTSYYNTVDSFAERFALIYCNPKNSRHDKILTYPDPDKDVFCQYDPKSGEYNLDLLIIATVISFENIIKSREIKNISELEKHKIILHSKYNETLLQKIARYQEQFKDKMDKFVDRKIFRFVKLDGYAMLLLKEAVKAIYFDPQDTGNNYKVFLEQKEDFKKGKEKLPEHYKYSLAIFHLANDKGIFEPLAPPKDEKFEATLLEETLKELGIHKETLKRGASFNENFKNSLFRSINAIADFEHLESVNLFIDESGSMTFNSVKEQIGELEKEIKDNFPQIKRINYCRYFVDERWLLWPFQTTAKVSTGELSFIPESLKTGNFRVGKEKCTSSL